MNDGFSRYFLEGSTAREQFKREIQELEIKHNAQKKELEELDSNRFWTMNARLVDEK